MRQHIRTLRAAACGNFMETLDFTLFAFFAVAIGHNFFPSSDPLLSTMASYATFAAGFIARPIGAYVLGRAADRNGRKSVLVLTLLLMGLSIALVLFAPNYQTAGIVGPIMVVIARLLAGFSAAGEIGAAAAMVIEAAAPNRRGRWGGFFSFSGQLGVVSGGLIATICYATFGAEQTNEWAWRVGYALGLLIVPFGYWARRNIAKMEHHKAPATVQEAHNSSTVRMVTCNAGLSAFGSSVFYVIIMFMPVFASNKFGIPFSTAMSSSLAASFVAGLGAIVGGMLSDMYGRKKVMRTAMLCSVALGIPLFLTLLQAPSLYKMMAYQWVAALSFGVYLGGCLPLMVESFPPSKRALAVGLGYALGIMVFGALAPVLGALALSKGYPMAPMFFVTGATLVSWLTLYFLDEPLIVAQPQVSVHPA